MSERIHVFDLLEGGFPKGLGGTVAIVGNDWFLRHRALEWLIRHAQIVEPSIRKREGDQATWRDVHDDLNSRSLFDEGGARVTVLSQADPFVTKHRAALEKWAESPARDATLFLELDCLPGNTRLYKLILQHGTVVTCATPIKKGSRDTPDDAAIQQWILQWGKRQHRVSLTVKQANVLVDRIGSVYGLLDNELAKLTLFADEKGGVTDAIVHELVGGWRTKTAWEIADSIAEGKIAVALDHLDGLFASGQNAIGIAAQLSWYFRRFGVAAHLIEQSERVGRKVALASALEQAGFYRYSLPEAERHLRRIGRERAKAILSWLRELDLRLKGSHSQEQRARMALEEFVMRLA